MTDDEIDADLEERLYAQIHHQEDAGDADFDPKINTGPVSIDFDPVKRRFLNNRYWVEIETPAASTYRPSPGASFRRPQAAKITTGSVLGIAGKMSEEATNNKPVEVTGFKAYTSILQSISAPVEPSNTNKNFRKPHNVSKKADKLDNCPDHQLSKLERVQKYLAKAQRVELAKKRSKKQQQLQEAKVVPTISLDSSSESEDDDVIEIPVPPPPLVCLDDSSDDSMQAPPTTPQQSKQSMAAMARASRCSSPSSSIISDDFIAPLDRNCLSDSMDSVNMTEEDLRAAGKVRSSVAQTLDKKKETGGSSKSRKQSTPSTPSTASNSTSNSNTPSTTSTAAAGNSKAARVRIPLLYKNLIASQKDVTIEHYHEDALNADDVVLVNSGQEVENSEPSEVAQAVTVVATTSKQVPTPPVLTSILKKTSRTRNLSTGDSVYMKGSSSAKAKRVPVQPEPDKNTTLSSDSENDEGVTQVVVSKPPKTPPTTTNTPAIAVPNLLTRGSKAVSKKRKSITEESSLSEPEPTAGVSYIHTGEAVSNAQNSPKRKTPTDGPGKKRQRLSTLTKTPESDNAFMSMISTIAQGGDVSDSDSVEMLPSTIEEITICSSEETVEVDNSRQGKVSAMAFNEFPHESVLKLVPIERKEMWYICNADKIGPLPTPRVRCLNCQEMGHVRSRCKQPYKQPMCYMCGETGHQEPRCRKTLCLMCGAPTRTFQIRCQQCQNMINHRCTNCRGLGHAAFLCPELWRRYHDTTEDVTRLTPLTGALIKRHRYCSVCGRRGHIADDCRLASAFLDFRPAPMAIVRYQSIYPGSRRNDEKRPPSRNRDEGMPSREERRSRWDDKEGTTTGGEVTGKAEVVPVKDSVVQPAGAVPAPPQPEKEQVAFKVTFDVQSDERQVTSTTKSSDSPAATTSDDMAPGQYVRKMSPNSDSNYSFSDFFEKEKEKEKEKLQAAAAEQTLLSKGLPLTVVEDFISINNPEPSESTNTADSNASPVHAEASPSHVSSSLQVPNKYSQPPPALLPTPVEVECDARIYLTKEHSKILINAKGSEFLQEMSKKFKIRVRLEWQSVGNLLTVTGFEQNQNAFHLQLTAFLNQSDKAIVQNASGWHAPLPKKRDQLIAVICGCISKLNTNLGNIYDLYRRQEYCGSGKRSIKEADKARRQLNMILFGQAGLRDGQRRLEDLKRCVAVLQKEPESATVDEQTRGDIEANFKYIFSANKHDNYGELLPQFKLWSRNRSRPSGTSGNNSPATTPRGSSGSGQQS